MNQPHNILTATYRIVTPMYLGDAGGTAESLRPPSFKGALRFWWRTLNWAKIRANNSTDKDALIALHQEESELFGNTPNSDKPNIGQALFSIKIDSANLPRPTPERFSDGRSYLGYGLSDRIGGALGSGQFTVELIYSPKRLTSSRQESIKDALTALGLFGGLGGRSRNGFGSIAIESINEQGFPCNTLQNYKAHVQTLIDRYPIEKVGLPPFTAFSKHTLISCSSNHTGVEAMHSCVGRKYKSFRESIDLNARKPFGLPLSRVDTSNRRASPLLIHMHPLDEQEDQAFSVYTYIPAKFHHDALYEDERIEFFSNVKEFAGDSLHRETIYP